MRIIKGRGFADKFEDSFVRIEFSFYFRGVLTFVERYSACEIRQQLVQGQMHSRIPPCGVFMLCIMFGFLQGYFSLPQGYPYQWGGYVYYPAPYIPLHPPMYSYPETCFCFDCKIETVFSEISNQEISGNGDTTPEIFAQMTPTTDHPTTTLSTTTGQLTEGLGAETKPDISEEESSRFLQQTTIQSTTELIIEPKTVSIYEISGELSTTASESTNQSKTELSTQSITETSTEPIIESSKIAPEGTESTTESTESATVTAYKFTKKLTEPKQQSNTESTIKLTESAKLITETTAESTIKMTEYMQRSTSESTTVESVSLTEISQHIPETTDGSTTKSSGSTARSTDKSTKEATESTTQTTVDFETETPTATTVVTADSKPNEENQHNVEDGSTNSTIRTAEGNMILNTVTGKEYFLGRTTEVSAESTGDSYQHLNTASNTELTTESNKVSRSGFATQKFSDDVYDGISQTEEYDFPYVDPA